MTNHLFSQLSHVELLTPSLEESVGFFRDYLGLEESGRDGDSVYMRCWGEFHHHSLKLTEAPESGLGHMAYRADSAEDLELAADLLHKRGAGIGWHDGDLGHGRAYRFRTPDGHMCEAFWDVEEWVAPTGDRTLHKTRPQKYPLRGAPCRRIDHVTLNCVDPKPNRELFQALGFRLNERQTFDDSHEELFAFLSVSNLTHDVGFGRDPEGASGRLNHVCFALETREELLRFADIAADYEITIDWGPGRHRGTELMYMYVREPGGNRVEICAGGYLIFAPDWKPIEWLQSEAPAVMWSGQVPESMYYATPPVAKAVL